MKKIVLTLAMLTVIFYSCNKENEVFNKENDTFLARPNVNIEKTSYINNEGKELEILKFNSNNEFLDRVQMNQTLLDEYDENFLREHENLSNDELFEYEQSIGYNEYQLTY